MLLFGRGGWFEPWFTARGIQIMFALPSMTLVTIFICIPFVIRSVAPVLEELGTEEEDAARTLGASTLQTLFRVILPNIRWGLLYGIALTTARAIGEIGAVLLVSGLLKGQTETATIYILTAFEERLDTQGYIVALTLAAISVLMLGVIEISKATQGQGGHGMTRSGHQGPEPHEAVRRASSPSTTSASTPPRARSPRSSGRAARARAPCSA